MKAGETRLITLDYSHWTIPIMGNGGPGLVPTPEISIVLDAESCSDQQIDGFGNPSVSDTIGWNAPVDIPAGVAHVWDPIDGVLPAANGFTLEVEPLGGPLNGVLDPAPATGTGWTYTPRAGFNGYETIWVRITDAQQRQIVRPIFFRVGSPTVQPPFDWGYAARNGVLIDRRNLEINSRLQTISFPMLLTEAEACDTIDQCHRFGVQIKALARDCNRLFSKIDCFDVFCQKC
ncbi:hypothetical protein [Synechococcus phage Ssp-JY38]